MAGAVGAHPPPRRRIGVNNYGVPSFGPVFSEGGGPRTSRYLCFSPPDGAVTCGDASRAVTIGDLSKFGRSKWRPKLSRGGRNRPDLTRNVRFSGASPRSRRRSPDASLNLKLRLRFRVVCRYGSGMARLPDIHVPDRLYDAVQALLAQRRVSYAHLVRELLRGELSGQDRAAAMDEVAVQALAEALLAKLAAAAPQLPVCPVCQTARRPDHHDVMFDVMAHAQCDQIVAKLDEGLE